MKRFHFVMLFLLLFLGIKVMAQNKKTAPVSVDQIRNYDALKASGQLEKLYPQFLPKTSHEKKSNTQPAEPRFGIFKSNKNMLESSFLATSNVCASCFTPVDSLLDTIVQFTIGQAPEYRNDDGSTVQMNLPFNFCFYGDTFNTFWINTNGNISFNSAVASYSASGFPDPAAVMIAPFWADVDIRDSASGLVYMRRTPHYVIIKWDKVGYYPILADKKNDFQLIISDGTDPIIPEGNNVRFCYADMQWTTGGASNGVDGFGGIPATVGANRGNGTDFIQFGRFDHPGSDYDGPATTTNPDGISWLDNQSFTFSTCFSNNVAPIVTGLGLCDTLTVCAGDTILINMGFLAPEVGQNTTITTTIDPPNSNVIAVLSNTPGNNALLQLQIAGNLANQGYTVMDITGTDDGAPAANTIARLVVHVIEFNTAAAHLDADCDTANGSITLRGFPDSANFEYSIDGGTTFVTDTLFSGLSGGLYNCVIRIPGGCSFDTTIFVFQPSSFAPPPTNSGPVCIGSSANINVPTIPGATYSWTGPNGFTSTSQNPVIPNITAADTGLYCVTLVTNGCTGTPNCTRLGINVPQVSAGIDRNLCGNDTLNLLATFSGTSVGATWSGGQGTFSSPGTATTNYIPGPNESEGDTVFLIATSIENGTCQADKDTLRVFIQGFPVVNISADQVNICAGGNAAFTATLAGTSTGGTWSNGNGVFTPGNTSLNGTYTPTQNEINTGQVLLIFTSNTTACGVDKDTLKVNINAVPTAVLSNNPILGVGQTKCSPNDSTLVLTLTGQSPWNVRVNTPNGPQTIPVSSSPYVINGNMLLAGTYSLDSINDANNCRRAYTNQTAVVKKINIGSKSFIKQAWCSLQNGRVWVSDSLNGNLGGPFKYVWKRALQNDTIGDSNDTLFNVGSGIYTVSITDSTNGCRRTDSDTIDFLIPFTAGLTADSLVGFVPFNVLFNNTTTLIDPSLPGITYTWEIDNGFNGNTQTPAEDFAYTFNSDSLYTVLLTVRLSEGCEDTASIRIKPEFPPKVNPPNVFTPGNGDNVNDLFKINPSGIKNFECIIFDRWGREVFRWNDPTQGWDGKKGDSGVYYYVLNYEVKADGSKKSLNGFVQLLR
jgi:gliding motility-associated-like protein